MKKIFLLLILLSAFPPISTDMYLSALPLLQQQWGQTEAAMNLSLVLWFVSYCICLLLYGPISDRTGRRLPLLFGIILFIIASIMCGLADGLLVFVIARIAQAAGAAASTVMAMAITRDLFDMRRRAIILAYIGVSTSLAPMLAPSLGGWMLTWLSWRWIFITQALLAAIVLLQVFFIQETLQHPLTTKLRTALSGYYRLSKNRRFFGLNAAMALPSSALFSFIGASPAIYITKFNLNPTQFGYIFGFNALAMMSGAYCYKLISQWMSTFKILIIGFIAMITGGFLLIVIPHVGVWHVALPMWIVSFFLGLTRPPANNVILEQVNEDIGSASSLINFAIMFVGALAMYIVSFAWHNKAMIIGIFTVISGLTATVTLFIVFQRIHDENAGITTI